MFKIFILIMVAFVLLFSFSAQAQKNNIGWSSSLPDTLAGADTSIFTPGVIIPTYSGVVSFTFNFTNILDSTNNCIMQGSMNSTDWIDLVTATAGVPAADSTLVDTDPTYLYYRLFTSTAAGDSVQIDAIKFVYKED